MLLLIDNVDSFTHNLARYFIELGQDVKVVRNNAISLDEIAACDPAYLVFSPGPCAPDQAGITLSAIARFAGNIPILGVCLGHQAIGQAFGANVVRAKEILHGKTSAISHSRQGLFAELPTPFTATRYHSLLLDADSIPDCLAVDAWHTDKFGDAEVMAIRHKTLPVWGVQFHPESLLTAHGHALLDNFLQAASAFRQP
ncbi:anthranilate synthase component II [Alteromonas halophila]|uniref:Glutamine amidotransferase n=1 Tax=Alteromonas halophila TaxID=516698 RepID=A0A918JHE8_9ALTE|nr:aminodeoxychorismate/anthranilate synthase component II [Alteromonas halophila]GGW78770.1 glutamine amidotransferase [Alteromonas halophila]